MTTILARESQDPQGVIVASGTRLAEETIRVLEQSDRVTIDLHGMSAISSSYFNIFLVLLGEKLAMQALRQVDFIFASPIHRLLFERSLEAANHNAMT
jgi:hypothetical protein